MKDTCRACNIPSITKLCSCPSDQIAKIIKRKTVPCLFSRIQSVRLSTVSIPKALRRSSSGPHIDLSTRSLVGTSVPRSI